MPRLVSLDSSNKRPPLGKRTRKATTGRNLDADSSKRKRKRARASMIKRETPCLPDVGALARLPLATTRAPLHPERLCDNEEGDDDLIVMAPSDSRGSRRPISIDSESRTPSDSSVVDLTNDSGMEDEDVIDLTSFQMPTIDSPVILSPGGPPVSLGVEDRERMPATTSEVVIVPESDDEVQVLSSSSSPGRRFRHAPQPTTPSDSLSATRPSTSFSPSPGKSTGKASITCPVCMDRASVFESMGRKLVTTNCGHVFCDECIRNAISSLHKCPVCNKKLTMRSFHRLFIS